MPAFFVVNVDCSILKHNEELIAVLTFDERFELSHMNDSLFFAHHRVIIDVVTLNSALVADNRIEEKDLSILTAY
jgi:hypothetical protein